MIPIQHRPTKGDTQLDLLVINKEKLAGDMVIHSSFGSSGHGILKFKILTGVRKDSCRVLRWTSGEQSIKTDQELTGWEAALLRRTWGL